MKIFVSGLISSGKSTLSKRIGYEFGIAYATSDQYLHVPAGKKKTVFNREDFRNFLSQNSSWVVEGIHVGMYHELVGENKPDLIVNLQIPNKTLCNAYKKRYSIAKHMYENAIIDPESNIIPELHYHPDCDADKQFRKFIMANKTIARFKTKYLRSKQTHEIPTITVRSYSAQQNVIEQIKQFQNTKTQ